MDFMMALTFDTLSYAKILEEAGIPRAQAEAVAHANVRLFNEVIDTHLATKNDFRNFELATKEDFRNFELATKEDFRNFELATKEDFRKFELATKEDIKTLEASTKAGLLAVETRLEVKLESQKSELMKTIFTMLLGQTAVFGILLKLFVPHA